MRAKWFLVIAAAVALTLGTAQPALADNNATGSVGAVQTGPVGATPTAGASQAGATAAASVPVAVGGSGDNTATNSVGAVQAGGGNTSNNSTGSVQVSSVSSSPSGDGSNTASNSTGGVQVGGGNASTGSAGVVQAGSPQAAPAVGASIVGEAVSASAASMPTALASTPVSDIGEPAPGTRTSEGAPRPNRNTFGVTKTPNDGPRTLAQLPFTGLGLLMFVLLGLALLATGLTARTSARLSV